MLFNNSIFTQLSKWGNGSCSTGYYWLIYFFIYLFILTGCSLFESRTENSSLLKSQNKTLKVFAAASLTEPFTELGNQFQEIHPDIKIVFNFAGSQQLAQQISQGAPADVFASADEIQMLSVTDTGRIYKKMVNPFTSNSLVVIFPSDNPAGLETLQNLAAPGIQLILADSAVPIGKYSLQYLENASLQTDFGSEYKNKVLDNVISYDTNVKAVLSKVVLGESDAGIVYTSDAASLEDDKIGVLPIPERLNVQATYFISPLNDSMELDSAETFIKFVLSPTGQSILAQFGFSGLPNNETN